MIIVDLRITPATELRSLANGDKWIDQRGVRYRIVSVSVNDKGQPSVTESISETPVPRDIS